MNASKCMWALAKSSAWSARFIEPTDLPEQLPRATAREARGVIAPSISYPAADERILRQRGPRAEERSGDLIAIGWRDDDIRRQWASNLGVGGLTAGSILLSSVFTFLMALAAEILIGLVSDGGALALRTTPPCWPPPVRGAVLRRRGDGSDGPKRRSTR
jgi:hypothetical protein